MVRILRSSLLLLLLSAAVLSVAISGGEKLRYKMAVGTKHSYTIVSDTKSKMQMMGQDIASTSWGMFGITMTGEKVGPNGEMILVATVDTNIAKIDSPMQKDTARVIKEINGKRVRMTINAMGKMVSSEPIDKIEVTQAMQMSGAMNPADIMRGLFAKLPEQEVGVGDSWKQTAPDTVNAQGFNMIVKPEVTFKVEGKETFAGYDCLKISFEGPSTEYGTGSRQGMELVLDGTVKVKGTAHFAPKEGLIVGIDQSTTTDMNISGTGEQMISIVQSSSSASTVTLVK